MTDKDTIYKIRIYRDANGVLREDHELSDKMTFIELQASLNYLLSAVLEVVSRMNKMQTDMLNIQAEMLNTLSKMQPPKYADEDLR